MSNKRPWINPCGRDMEDVDCSKKRKLSLKENYPNVEHKINAILEQLEELKKFMSSTFDHVKEESLISHEYDFLNIPKNIENTYVRAFHILQANVMAIEQLLKELKKQSGKEYPTYNTHLNQIKEELIQLKCNMEFIIESKGLCYENVTEDKMSRQFKNDKGSFKIQKHFIAFRQIHDNMKYLSKELKQIKSAPKEEFKIQNGDSTEVLKVQNDTPKEELKLQNGATKELKLKNGGAEKKVKLQNVTAEEDFELNNGVATEIIKFQNCDPKEK